MNVRSTVRTTAVTAVLAAAGSGLLSAPALAGGAEVARASALHVYGDSLPEGASARVHSTSTPGGRTVVTLTVKGLAPRTTYGAHAHVNACSSSDPLASGGHWVRPGGGVNPQDEIWLDVTTDASGNGSTTAVQEFAFSPGNRPASVIIHRDPTDPGTGVAGPRLACVTVGF